jgi:hypothetical protein
LHKAKLSNHFSCGERSGPFGIVWEQLGTKQHKDPLSPGRLTSIEILYLPRNQNCKSPMQKLLLIFLLLLNCHTSPAQVNERIDSLSTAICATFKQAGQPLDSVFILETFRLHLWKYFEKMDSADIDQGFEKINTRLQTTCNSYKEYMKRYNTGDWISVDKCPASQISNEDLNAFFSIKNFYYIEPAGDTTRVEITGNSWTDHLKDDTYSKLSLTRLSPQEFVITFKESNNRIKQNMSKVGDQYYYSIISRTDNSFLLCASVRQLTGATLFKVYASGGSDRE